MRMMALQATISPMPTLVSALAAQLIGALIAAAATRLAYPPLFQAPLLWALLQGICATVAGYKLGAGAWWMPIHLLFLPLALIALRADIPPGFWLAAFVLLLMLFWRTGKDRVPLYLSNRRTMAEVAMLLPNETVRFLDIGCGTGSLLTELARQRPDAYFAGIEHAPLPFFIAWWRARSLPNLKIHYGNFWRHNLTPYDIVYAFLSPQPMTALWKKACAEMRPGSQLISNSFIVLGASADRQVEVPDRRRTQLFCYSPAESSRTASGD